MLQRVTYVYYAHKLIVTPLLNSQILITHRSISFQTFHWLYPISLLAVPTSSVTRPNKTKKHVNWISGSRVMSAVTDNQTDEAFHNVQRCQTQFIARPLQCIFEYVLRNNHVISVSCCYVSFSIYNLLLFIAYFCTPRIQIDLIFVCFTFMLRATHQLRPTLFLHI